MAKIKYKHMLLPVHITPYMTIHHDPAVSLGVLTWDGPVPSQAYKEGLEIMLSAGSELGISNWLSDARKLRGVSDSDKEWSRSYWQPHLCQTPIRKMAILLPAGFFDKADILAMKPNPKNPVTFEHHLFGSRKEAMRWLRQDTHTPA